MAISYVGAVLLEEDRDALLVAAGHRENEQMKDWLEVAHHMTLCMGAAKGDYVEWVGRHVMLKVIAFGSLFFEDGSGVAAVQVECEAPSKNAVKHVTIAHTKNVKGLPAKSNDITNWEPMPEPITVRALVREIEHKKPEPAAAS